MLIKHYTKELLKKCALQLHCRATHYDVLIIGGGVMGSSTAYFLKSKEPSLSIGVIERDSTYANASSALSVSGIRQQFSIPENIKLSQWSYEFMKNVAKHLSVPFTDQADVQLFKSSYMLLASQQGIGILKSNCNVQRGCGADIAIYDVNTLKEKFKWMNTEGVVAGSFCEGENEGWFDGWSLLVSFRKKAACLGVDYIDGSCSKINVTSKVKGVAVRCKEGDLDLLCSAFVNTAGCWSGMLMDTINVFLPVCPRKRYVYVIDCPRGPRDMPLFVDTTGLYCRPEGCGTLYLCGQSPSEEEEPCTDNLEVDYDFFYETIWPRLAYRIPAMEELKLRHSWSGFYDYNIFDQNAVIGVHPEIQNLYFATGFSGHGIQQSPAVGNALSELLIDGKYSDIDLRRFGYERLIDNKPVREINVI